MSSCVCPQYVENKSVKNTLEIADLHGKHHQAVPVAETRPIHRTSEIYYYEKFPATACIKSRLQNRPTLRWNVVYHRIWRTAVIWTYIGSNRLCQKPSSLKQAVAMVTGICIIWGPRTHPPHQRKAILTVKQWHFSDKIKTFWLNLFRTLGRPFCLLLIQNI